MLFVLKYYSHRLVPRILCFKIQKPPQHRIGESHYTGHLHTGAQKGRWKSSLARKRRKSATPTVSCAAPENVKFGSMYAVYCCANGAIQKS